MSLRIAIVGSVGVPARYGGFETLAEALVKQLRAQEHMLHVYCQRSAYGNDERHQWQNGHKFIYIPLTANGAVSILYDAVSLIDAIFRQKCQVVLCLGASATLLFPLLRLVRPKVRIIFNLDGLESRRSKWSPLGKAVLHSLEFLGVYFAHCVVADNRVIRSLVFHRYGRKAYVIAYGGDHARPDQSLGAVPCDLPTNYILAISRIVPENNVDAILEAFDTESGPPLVYVGNWDGSNYGRKLYERYGDHPRIRLLNPIYDTSVLNTLRVHARACVHGHSVGGTNPALVEALYWAPKILAFNCGFNRATLSSAFSYWQNANELKHLLSEIDIQPAPSIEELKQLQGRYLWTQIAVDYVKAIDGS